MNKVSQMKHITKIYIRGCSCDICRSFNDYWIKLAATHNLPIVVSRLDPHKYDDYE